MGHGTGTGVPRSEAEDNGEQVVPVGTKVADLAVWRSAGGDGSDCSR